MLFVRTAAVALMLWLFPLLPAAAPVQEQQGATPAAANEAEVHLYFFWSSRCPHCLAAKPFVEGLPSRLPWLKVHSHEILSSPQSARLYHELATSLGQDDSSVPAFLFCGEMMVGFDSEATTGAVLLQRLQTCRDGGKLAAAPLSLPVLGNLDPAVLSLPVFTLIIAGLDAFNPCAFFVLLFLLSLLVHEKTRTRMLVIGGVFIAFSGLIYFVFMAAWLNVFLMLREIEALTIAAGVVAVVTALVNIKDFFLFRRGVSLSIPESAKPGLFRRMRAVLGAGGWPALLIGTATLALAANTYELLCTSGFPMVYTRVLTLHQLEPWVYYLYLALYNLIYVIPLLLIALVSAFTLGTRKLTEQEGRLLKLMSGVMMLGLGMLLLFAPQLLSNVGVAAGLLVFAVGVAALAKKAGLQ